MHTCTRCIVLVPGGLQFEFITIYEENHIRICFDPLLLGDITYGG